MRKLTEFQSKVYELVKRMKQIYDLKSDDKIISDRIQRGSKSPISDAYEEEFAKFLSTVLDNRYSFIIDFHLSKYCKEEGKYKQFFKPDILVLEKVDEEKSRVCAIFECKCDISYAEDNWVENMHSRMKFFNEFNVKFKRYLAKQNQETGKLELVRDENSIPERTSHILLESVENLKTLGIVLCKANDHNRWGKVTDTSEYPNVKVMYLSNQHLNNPSVNIDDILELNKGFWDTQLKDYLVKEMKLLLK
ncbi:hypothetical protein SAMN05880501_10920 [Ureibacillus xyleni]|uniref:Restriction endonuclease n=1 Tax=Ureibacillus xyleni TaxID=614648 RepID=A0A285TA19_9BACL|nr:hypothetical protein [Ureibacillus xyleni]SOC16553.1 hypothetical protein SAMN05880501_10920 [Ureibacillus xyleni]